MDKQTILPSVFIDKMRSILPKNLHMEDFIAISQQPLRRAVRVNTLKISINAFKERANEHGWQLTEIPWCKEGFWIAIENELTPLGNSAEHLAGLFYIQEASSMMPVSALFHFFQSTEKSILLDAAAAPGSKTTQIAANMANKGLIIANEYSSSRIKMLHANIQRCGIQNVALSHFNADVFGRWLPQTFDAILLDAPCSGEGTVRKDTSAMKNWSQDSIEKIAAMQKTLITSAYHALKANGILIYSTCTLSKEENQDVCHYLKESFPDSVHFLNLKTLFPEANKTLTEEGFLHIWPQVYDSEGFFVAAIQKTKDSSPEPVDKRLGKFPFTKCNKKTKQALYHYFETQFAIQITTGELYQRDKEFWLFPSQIEPLINELRFSRLGIKISEQFGKGNKIGFKTMHEFVSSFGDQASKNKIQLTAQQAQSYYQGRDVFEVDSQGTSGEVLVCYRDNVIGLGKILKNKLKNNLPRDLIRDNNLFTN